MKKTTKLIAMLMVIALLATVVAAAIAEDKIFTSGVFSIPKERVEMEIAQQPVEEEFPLPEEEFEPEPEPEFEPEFAEERPAEEQGWEEPEVERQVLISSNRKDVVIEGEIIDLYSELIGFDGVQVYYQWQVDRGDGAGWVDVEGATGPNHSFVARRDTILYSWRLTITTDE